MRDVWRHNYVFNSFSANLDPDNPPRLEFSINGQTISPDLTLTAPPGAWIPMQIVWNSGQDTTASIAIADMTTTGIGNDFALDDLSFSRQKPATWFADLSLDLADFSNPGGTIFEIGLGIFGIGLGFLGVGLTALGLRVAGAFARDD
jgi:hypothetical protein